MTKTAITTVASRDCSEVSQSVESLPGFEDVVMGTGVLAAADFSPFFGVGRACRRSQVLEHLAGGVLLRLFLGGPFGPARELRFPVSGSRNTASPPP